MNINDNEFPLVIQAYQTSGREDRFVAEQMVNSQLEADNFTSRYAGLLIKAKKVSESELERNPPFAETTTLRDNSVVIRRKNSTGIVLFLLILILVVVGLATGWIQRTFNLNF
jgi:hypothetical protein